jgi:cytochrome c-type biogenesis protein CcmH
MEALTQRLAERMKTRPDDAEGWSMLGRSYGALGRYAEAVQAYQHVIDLRPKDAQALADSADALGMANGRKLDGEPEKLIARALQLDPDNAKALSLAGTIALDRGDAASAARLWEHAVKGVEPGSEMAGQLLAAVAEARQRAGLPPLPATATPPMAPAVALAASGPRTEAGAAVAGGQAPATPAASVQVRVTLAPALAAQAGPDDTVFIFARALQGPKAPLAIQRRQVKDLPLDLTLDDTMAMSPALRLSTVAQVVIGARISKSGNAMPQPGDLQGLSQTVAVGARGVQVQIGETVR